MCARFVSPNRTTCSSRAARTARESPTSVAMFAPGCPTHGSVPTEAASASRLKIPNWDSARGSRVPYGGRWWAFTTELLPTGSQTIAAELRGCPRVSLGLWRIGEFHESSRASRAEIWHEGLREMRQLTTTRSSPSPQLRVQRRDSRRVSGWRRNDRPARRLPRHSDKANGVLACPCHGVRVHWLLGARS